MERMMPSVTSFDPSKFSGDARLDLKLDDPVHQRRIALLKIKDTGFARVPNRDIARVIRIFLRPTAEQASVETDADAVEREYGVWDGSRIASICGRLDHDEAGLAPRRWKLIAWELSWRMRCQPRRIPIASDLNPLT